MYVWYVWYVWYGMVCVCIYLQNNDEYFGWSFFYSCCNMNSIRLFIKNMFENILIVTEKLKLKIQLKIKKEFSEGRQYAIDFKHLSLACTFLLQMRKFNSWNAKFDEYSKYTRILESFLHLLNDHIICKKKPTGFSIHFLC